MTARKRAGLGERLRRLRDLHELGDLDRPVYLIRREAIQNELTEVAPQPLPELSQAERVLNDFSIFWRHEADLDAKRQLLQLVFERVWLDKRPRRRRPAQTRFRALIPAAPIKTAAKSAV
jgi:hypothetical protein